MSLRAHAELKSLEAAACAAVVAAFLGIRSRMNDSKSLSMHSV